MFECQETGDTEPNEDAKAENNNHHSLPANSHHDEPQADDLTDSEL
jgi:hypothetical protein